MLGNRNIGKTKASEAADRAKAQKAAEGLAPGAKHKNILHMIVGGLSLGLFIAAGLLFNSLSNNRFLELQNKTIKAKMIELSQPKYDSVKDFILAQCNTEGVFCRNTQTTNPSLEMLKFLVDFREKPNSQYRLIFELSVGGDPKTREVISCNGGYANFYVCQEITASSPTDIIRAFEKSYRSLEGEATYSFNLMVKPIGDLDYANPITIKTVD